MNMKVVVRPQHIISLGGYIVEVEFPYRNLIVVNPTQNPIKIEIPVFNTKWIDEHRELGLDIIPTKDDNSFLRLWGKAKANLDKIKEENPI